MNKRHILEEIRRTAEANGGVPLGKRRFFQATGVGDADWERFWIRWGDAVREAGYEPKQMTTAYSDAVLFEKLIVLSRELGRFPAFREIRMKTRGDNTFPTDKTIQRLGSKQEIAEKLRSYCEGRMGCEDVVAMCSAVIEPGRADQEEDEDAGSDPEVSFGFVYLMKSGRYYKIGRSNAIGRREREIALQLPEKATTVHTIRTDDPVGIEAYWHGRFGARRRNGEWFELSREDVKAFKRRKFM